DRPAVRRRGPRRRGRRPQLWQARRRIHRDAPGPSGRHHRRRRQRLAALRRLHPVLVRFSRPPAATSEGGGGHLDLGPSDPIRPARKARTMLTTDAARDELRTILAPGTTVNAILRHVSRSGMSRAISLVVIAPDGTPRDLDYLAIRAGLG